MPSGSLGYIRIPRGVFGGVQTPPFEWKTGIRGVHTPPLDIFCLLACFLVREVGNVQGYPYPMSGKWTNIFWGRKKKCQSLPPHPRSVTFSGLARHHSLDALLKHPPPPLEKKSCVRHCWDRPVRFWEYCTGPRQRAIQEDNKRWCNEPAPGVTTPQVCYPPAPTPPLKWTLHEHIAQCYICTVSKRRHACKTFTYT